MIFYGFDPMGFITIKLTTILGRNISRFFFSKHQTRKSKFIESVFQGEFSFHWNMMILKPEQVREHLAEKIHPNQKAGLKKRIYYTLKSAFPKEEIMFMMFLLPRSLNKNKPTYSWQFFVTFLGWLSDPHWGEITLLHSIYNCFLGASCRWSNFTL